MSIEKKPPRAPAAPTIDPNPVQSAAEEAPRTVAPSGSSSSTVPAGPQQFVLPEGVSPRLYSRDLAPTTKEGRTWHAYSIFTLWANDVHSLGNYAFAIGLFALGLGGWQILLAFLLGATFLFALLTLSGFMGERHGVPFPVMSRIAFGIQGAKIASGIRGGVAVVWFGIQTYLASMVLQVLVIALLPGAAALAENNVLGLSTLGWITFLVLWAIQVLIVIRGMEMIRKYEAFAGPIILVTMLALAIWMLAQADFSIAWSTAESLTGGAMWLKIVEAAALWVVIYGTFVLNFCDFTRGCPSQRAVVVGNFFGIPINMLFFASIVVVLTGAQYKINGTIIEGPTDVVQAIPNTLLLALACLALIILTIAVNLMANFVAPVYALVNFFPRRLNFWRAALVSAVVGLVILPWNLYNSPAVILYFLGGLGAFLGPLFGVIMADYWLIRKGKVHVPDLYSEDPRGEYAYDKGLNRRALVAAAVASLIALPVALLPVFEAIAGFSWFLGAITAALVYLVISVRGKEYTAVAGDDIALPPTH